MKRTAPNITARDRAEIESNCVRCGMERDVAKYIASRVGVKPPTPEHDYSTHTRAAFRPIASLTVADRLRRICSLYGANKLAPDFERASVSLRSVVAMLTRATGTARGIGPAGVESIRFSLAQRGAA